MNGKDIIYIYRIYFIKIKILIFINILFVRCLPFVYLLLIKNINNALFWSTVLFIYILKISIFLQFTISEKSGI